MEIDIDYFQDGYTIENINCIDMMLAGLASCLQKGLYEQYCFIGAC